MEKSKIVLEKIEVKKIKKRSDNKLNMLENESRKFKSKLSTAGKVSKEKDLIDIALKSNQNVAKTYPKTMTMAGDGNQQTDGNGDLKISKKCKLRTGLSEDEKRCYSGTDSSTRPTNASISSFSQQSSFGFYESESSVQGYKYDKLKDESNSSLKELDAESEKTIQSDNSDESFPNEYITQKDNPSISQNVYHKMTVRNSVGEKRSVARVKHFGDEDININRSENLVRNRCAPQKDNLSTPQNVYDKMTVRNSVGEKRFVAEARHEVDSGENSMQMQDSSSSPCEEQDQIKELKGALEKSANCLVKCLESFQSKTKKQKKLRLRKDYSTRKYGRNTSEYKDGEKDVKILDASNSGVSLSEYKDGEKDVKILDASNSGVSLSMSHDLENNSVSGVKQIIHDEACLTRVNSPKSIYTKTTKSKNCSRDCDNGRCLHFQRTRRNLNNDLVQEGKASKKKITSSASKGDLSNNQTASSVKLQESRSSRSKHKKRYHLTPPDMPILAVKVMGAVDNGNGSFRLADRSNADDNQPFENWLSSLEKSNLIKKGKNEERRLKRKEKTNLVEISHKKDQLEKYEEGDEVSEDNGVSEDNEVLEDNEDNRDPNMLMFLTFIFVISVFFCFLFSIFIFI